MAWWESRNGFRESNLIPKAKIPFIPEIIQGVIAGSLVSTFGYIIKDRADSYKEKKEEEEEWLSEAARLFGEVRKCSLELTKSVDNLGNAHV